MRNKFNFMLENDILLNYSLGVIFEGLGVQMTADILLAETMGLLPVLVAVW